MLKKIMLKRAGRVARPRARGDGRGALRSFFSKSLNLCNTATLFEAYCPRLSERATLKSDFDEAIAQETLLLQDLTLGELAEPMDALKNLFANNLTWANQMNQESPGFFEKLSELQAPNFLWIGCADSRVPANEIVGLMPGELFVHRNVANIVSHTDLNCLSVLQYAVEALKVRHVIVCGHYGCGGVIAAQQNRRLGLIDNWLRHVQDVQEKYRGLLEQVPQGAARADRLCELNVIEQAVNVCQTTVVQDAWASGQDLTVHGWIYRLNNGRLHDLGLCVSSNAGLHKYYQVNYGIVDWPVPQG